MTTNLNEMVKAPRFRFIADFLVLATRKKSDREFSGGYQVRRSGGVYRLVQTQVAGGTETYSTDDPAKLFDYARRGPLGYFIRKAEELRAAAYAQ